MVSAGHIDRQVLVTAEGELTKGRIGKTDIELVIEGLAAARTVAVVGIGVAVQAVLVDERTGSVGEPARLRVDAGGGVEQAGQAGQQLGRALDADRRLRQVARRNAEIGMGGVLVDQVIAEMSGRWRAGRSWPSQDRRRTCRTR